MKILLSTSMSGLGGTEHATYRLGKLLCDNGHDVHLASSDGPLVKDAVKAGMTWHRIDFYDNAFTHLKGMCTFAKLLKRENPDIVHCQMARIVPACAIAAKLASSRTKVFWHSRGLVGKTYPKVVKFFTRLGVYAIANCKNERDKLLRLGFPPERTTFTYNALHKADYVPEKTQKDYILLGTLSRLDYLRAVDQTLDVFKILIDRGLPVRLHVAGIGEDLDALKRQAERLGIADKVTFLGGVRNLTEYFKEVDILLNNPRCPGDSCAGVGNNVLEAGLYDTPVVTYNMGGIKEMVIQGETGYCFPLGAAEEFADAVEMLVKDKSLRDRIGKALHRRVAHLCSDEEIYRTTMNAYNMEAV